MGPARVELATNRLKVCCSAIELEALGAGPLMAEPGPSVSGRAVAYGPPAPKSTHGTRSWSHCVPGAGVVAEIRYSAIAESAQAEVNSDV